MRLAKLIIAHIFALALAVMVSGVIGAAIIIYAINLTRPHWPAISGVVMETILPVVIVLAIALSMTWGWITTWEYWINRRRTR